MSTKQTKGNTEHVEMEELVAFEALDKALTDAKLEARAASNVLCECFPDSPFLEAVKLIQLVEVSLDEALEAKKSLGLLAVVVEKEEEEED